MQCGVNGFEASNGRNLLMVMWFQCVCNILEMSRLYVQILAGQLLLRSPALPGDVGTFDDQAHLSRQRAGVDRFGCDGDFMHDVFDRLPVLRGQHMGRLMLKRELHRRVDENAPLEIVRLDDEFNHIEHRVQLANRRWPAPLADHLVKRLLQPAIL